MKQNKCILYIHNFRTFQLQPCGFLLPNHNTHNYLELSILISYCNRPTIDLYTDMTHGA